MIYQKLKKTDEGDTVAIDIQTVLGFTQPEIQ